MRYNTERGRKKIRAGNQQKNRNYTRPGCRGLSSAKRIVQSSYTARAATRRHGTAEASREMRIRVHQKAAHASRGGHSRAAGWRRGGRRRAAGGGGRGRATGRGAAVRSESWIRSQARARVATRTRTSNHAHARCMLVRRARKPERTRTQLTQATKHREMVT